MLWRKGRRSDNVVDARDDSGGGMGGGGMRIGGRGLSLGGVAIVVVVGLLMGQDPMQILGSLLGQMDAGQAPARPQVQGRPATGADPQVDFVRAVLGDTEDTWGQIFAHSNAQYEQPKLILFNGGVNSACGFASSAVGPFYCPGDHRVYLDLGFFREMEQRFSAAGDFARAYVIAHEVGHHVQNLLGISAKVEAARRRGAPMEGAHGLSVRLELQADCFAGVWANKAQQRLQWLEPGDIESALNAANAIGDDRLQKQSRGTVVPDSFTHGTSAQRMRWFKLGFDSGSPGKCDTFKAQAL
ncbi:MULTISPECIES: neutral zinc metallopeptidase [unclassified Pseudomonas]|uniref:KPN_02809 family neutral zinc metallopeptidase n=1 Tax=unclassified Pseudomonas TaxID=196821 RepID=UPI0002A41539|nr:MULTISPECIES: neutral zinc metallopeptidase [unclassified Pseudomonas]MBB1605884.1 metallopeptidase [Pseudomonas sp. UMC76]MBB1639069.1 metallopeptidase [Pseudomonas sp. UME83]NTX89018.1 neutral zinc metallopeptidase [Pseudomonas sp. UMA643]NTY17706.1 neutral zinc metallopeptidase [Pseudomonas sp. UMC3103]NTY25064.1 neutral zinc metallopeptidase [Pseudomonas sp. UMA603]